MSESRALTQFSEVEYEAIEAAVMETARGRWFLGEFARRNRTADTQVLLQAINRLEQAVAGERTAQTIDRMRHDLMEMAKAIARMKEDIASIRPADAQHVQHAVASDALDGIVRTAERATSGILDAAEHVQEAAWTLREEGASPTLCDELDRRTTEIWTACSFQDLATRRAARLVQTVQHLERRITAMIDAPGAEPDGPDRELVVEDVGHAARPHESVGLDRCGMDVGMVEDEHPPPMPMEPGAPDPAADCPAVDGEMVVDDLAFVLVPAEPSIASQATAMPPPARAAAEDPQGVAHPEVFASLDELDTREKLRRFT